MNYDCKLYIYGLSGNLIMIIEPYKNYPGITKLSISPNGHYITLGYCDNNIRLFHYLSFKLCKEINPIDLLLPNILNKKSDFFFS
jgi:WD40 repeat protein